MTQINRSNVQELAQKFYSRNDPTGWFEELYSTAKGDESAIPWADLAINPNLDSWVKKNNLRGDGKKALVVGCGLGDDAQALSELGFKVTGFDIAPTAIAWCKKRFPESQVNYIVDDLLNPQVINQQKYDFVLESYRTHLGSLLITISLGKKLSPKMFQNNWLNPSFIVQLIEAINSETIDFS